jgi:hypothetical protein
MTLHQRPRLVGALAVLLLCAAVPQPRLRAADPQRIVLIVDSSSAVTAFLNPMRAGLTAFVDAIPEDAELTMISTGGQLRVRVPPTTDRARLRKEAAGFASDGGGNALIETLLESDQRFLRKATDRRGVVVVLSTDSASRVDEPRVDQYNRFLNDFLERGGHAHAVVIRGNTMGSSSAILDNLTKNTNGLFWVLATANGTADRMKAIAERIGIEP